MQTLWRLRGRGATVLRGGRNDAPSASRTLHGHAVCPAVAGVLSARAPRLASGFGCLLRRWLCCLRRRVRCEFAQRRIQRDRERGISAYEIRPTEFLAPPLSFERDLQALGRQSNDKCLPLELQFAFQRLVERRRHLLKPLPPLGRLNRHQACRPRSWRPRRPPTMPLNCRHGASISLPCRAEWTRVFAAISP
jgi:hypothetical protein